MKRAMFGSLLLVAVVGLLLCWAPAAFADDPMFAITGDTGSLYGVATSPYTTDNSAVGSVICDDFIDHINFNDEHNYNEYSANSLIAGTHTGIWPANMYAGTATALYEAAAYLALQIYGSTDGAQKLDNWALWALMDPSAAVASLNSAGVSQGDCETIFGVGAYSGGACHDTLGTGGLIHAALNNVPTAGEFNNLVVYAPFASGSSGPECTVAGTCNSQEFFGMVPEGGAASLYLILSGVTCLGAMFYSRRRTAMGGLA